MVISKTSLLYSVFSKIFEHSRPQAFLKRQMSETNTQRTASVPEMWRVQRIHVTAGVVLFHVPSINAVVTELLVADFAAKRLWVLMLGRHVTPQAALVPRALATDGADAGQVAQCPGLFFHGLHHLTTST